MSYISRRRAPGINTTIAAYQPSQHDAYTRHDSAYASTPASASASRSPPITPLSATDENYTSYDENVSDGMAHGEDYVLAMHDFVPVAPNVQCLSFRAGQVIHVLNRDQTGWWDGELDGRRGWFPSNYVNAQPSRREISPPRHRKGRSGRNRVASAGAKQHFSAASISSQGSNLDDINSTPSLLVSLVQALSLLQNAVRARRITHFQPSTACVISCVRSVLSATDCLGRDSPALAAFPSLAASRKQVLSDLARLVNQARKASEMRGLEEAELDSEINEMMRMGQTVFVHVRSFLDVAVDCGLELPERKAISPTDDPYDRLLGSTPTPGVNQEDSDPDRHEVHRNGIPLADRAPTSAAAMRARSMVDLRKSRALHSPVGTTFPQHQSSAVSATIAMQRVESENYATVLRENGHRTGPQSPGKSSRASASSVSSFNSESDADYVAVWPTGPTSTAQVLLTLRATHDRLLSIIAAFIGHVHSHSQNAHASSKGHLIEMTRETVDQVRQLLALVDSVMATQEIAEAKPRELMALETAKTTLFAYTSSLVDSIRAITSLRASENEDEEKGTCLQAATGALRAGAECVTSVKLCLSRRIGEEPFTIFVLPPPSTDPPQQSRSSSPSSPTYSHYSGPIYYSDDVQEFLESPTSDNDQPMYEDERPGEETLRSPEELDPTTHIPQGPVPPAARGHLSGYESPTLRGPATPLAGAFPPSAPQISIFIDQVPLQDDDEVASLSGGTLTTDEVSGSEARGRGMSVSSASTAPTEQLPEAGANHQPKVSLSALEEKIKSGDLPSVPMSSSTTPVILAPAESDADNEPADPEAWLLTPDFDSRDVMTNSEGVLTGASLDVLVEKMTPPRSPPEPSFAVAFYLTFRLFTSPEELLQALVVRYSIQPPSLNPADLRVWQERKLLPVRVRICNLLKTWLETYWRPEQDSGVLSQMQQFVREKMIGTPIIGSQAQRVLDIITKRLEQESGGNGRGLNRARSADRLRPVQLQPGSNSTAVPPTPVMNKTLHASLRNSAFNAVSILDFDVLELARQLTLMESRLYCAIRPEELLASGQAGVRPSESVRAVTSLSTYITGWVTECILNELDARKRTGLLKYFIKLADRCLNQLNNFSTLRAVMAALDSSTISRLTKTWAGLPARHRSTLDSLRAVVDHSRNHAEYRSRLRNLAPPAVPFLGIYLTDIIFCRDGNPAHRASPSDPNRTLLNFHRYSQLARIVQDMQRFQMPYNLLEIAEAQKYLTAAFGDLSKGKGTDLQDLYRRSLLVEPRQPTDQQPDKGKDLFAWGRLGGSS